MENSKKKLKNRKKWSTCFKKEWKLPLKLTVFANISIKSKSSEYFLHPFRSIALTPRTHFAIELALRFYTT